MSELANQEAGTEELQKTYNQERAWFISKNNID